MLEHLKKVDKTVACLKKYWFLKEIVKKEKRTPIECFFWLI